MTQIYQSGLFRIPFDLLFNEIPCYISVQDRNFRIIETNRRFIDDFGSGIGRLCHEAYKNRSERCLVCPVAETFQDGQFHVCEELLTNIRGESINVIVRATPLRDRTGEIVAVMEMITNITEFKKLQSELTNLGTMVSSLAHTVKGIVQGLDGAMYVMESGFRRRDDETLNKGWDMIQRNVKRVSHLVLDMLYYAKPRIPQPQSIDMVAIAREITELFQKSCQDNSIELRTNFTGTEKLDADQKAVHSMLLNLLENAIDACKWDREKTSHIIDFTVGGDKESAICEITDNGVGMDEETKSKLFSPFYSTKGTTGTGIGMIVAHKAVQEHSGAIQVESAPGKGTRIIVRIPRKSALTVPVDTDEKNSFADGMN